MIDSKKFVDNVRYLCGMREMSIGYLEKEIGVTVGYFSRYKNNNTKVIPLNVAYSVSKIFECSIEELIEKDFRKETRIAVLENAIQSLSNELEKLKEGDSDGKE